MPLNFELTRDPSSWIEAITCALAFLVMNDLRA